MSERLLRLKEVKNMTGWTGDSTIYKKIKENTFPLPDKRGGYTNVWKLSVIELYIKGKENWEKYNNKIREERGEKPIYTKNNKEVA